MSKPKIVKRGPYVLEVETKVYYWCACGYSENQPYCDGSHKAHDMSPLPVEISEAKKAAWCGCKYTNKPPFCDGTHRKLDE